MMAPALGQTVWVAVGEADVPPVVERIVRAKEPSAERAESRHPARLMPAPAPLHMPIREF